MSRSYHQRKSIRVLDNKDNSYLNETIAYSKHKSRPGIKNKISYVFDKNKDKMECSSNSSNDNEIMDVTDLNSYTYSDNESTDDDSKDENVISVSDDDVVDYDEDTGINDNLHSIQGCLLHQYSSLT